MKGFTVSLILLLSAAPLMAQMVVVDPVNNTLSAVNSSERVSESEACGSVSQALERSSQRIESLIDSVQRVYNSVTPYISAIDEVEQTAREVCRSSSVYSRIVADVRDMDFLLPSEQLRAINTAASQIEEINACYRKIESLTTTSAASMNDGERVELVRHYLESIRASNRSLESLYRTLVQTGYTRAASSSLVREASSFMIFDLK